MIKLTTVVSFLVLSLSTLTIGCGDSDGGSTVTDDPSVAAGSGGSGGSTPGGSSGAGNSPGGSNSGGSSTGVSCASDPLNGKACLNGHYGCSTDGKSLVCIPSGGGAGTGGTGGTPSGPGGSTTCSAAPTVTIKSYKDTGCAKQEFKIGGAISTSSGVHLFESYPTTSGSMVTGAEVLLAPEPSDCGPTVGTFTSWSGYASVSSSLEVQFYRFNAAQLDILWQKEQGTTPQVDTRYSANWKKLVNSALRCHLGLPSCTLGSSLPAGLITNEGGGTSSNLAVCQELTYGFVRN